MSTVLSIQARMGSTRLPGKMLLPLGQKRVIDWVYKRCKSSDIGTVCVSTTTSDPDEAIVSWCERNNIDYIRGPESNLLERHLLAADEANAETVIRINGDCPFVPPAEIRRVNNVCNKQESVYVTNQTGTVPHGLNVDVIPVSVLRRLHSEGYSHPVTPLRESGENIIFTENSEWGGFRTAELTLDTPSDYWRFVDAVDSVGSTPRDVAEWIEEQHTPNNHFRKNNNDQ